MTPEEFLELKLKKSPKRDAWRTHIPLGKINSQAAYQHLIDAKKKFLNTNLPLESLTIRSEKKRDMGDETGEVYLYIEMNAKDYAEFLYFCKMVQKNYLYPAKLEGLDILVHFYPGWDGDTAQLEIAAAKLNRELYDYIKKYHPKFFLTLKSRHHTKRSELKKRRPLKMIRFSNNPPWGPAIWTFLPLDIYLTFIEKQYSLEEQQDHKVCETFHLKYINRMPPLDTRLLNTASKNKWVEQAESCFIPREGHNGFCHKVSDKKSHKTEVSTLRRLIGTNVPGSTSLKSSMNDIKIEIRESGTYIIVKSDIPSLLETAARNARLENAMIISKLRYDFYLFIIHEKPFYLCLASEFPYMRLKLYWHDQHVHRRKASPLKTLGCQLMIVGGQELISFPKESITQLKKSSIIRFHEKPNGSTESKRLEEIVKKGLLIPKATRQEDLPGLLNAIHEPFSETPLIPGFVLKSLQWQEERTRNSGCKDKIWNMMNFFGIGADYINLALGNDISILLTYLYKKKIFATIESLYDLLLSFWKVSEIATQPRCKIENGKLVFFSSPRERYEGKDVITISIQNNKISCNILDTKKIKENEEKYVPARYAKRQSSIYLLITLSHIFLHYLNTIRNKSDTDIPEQEKNKMQAKPALEDAPMDESLDEDKEEEDDDDDDETLSMDEGEDEEDEEDEKDEKDEEDEETLLDEDHEIEPSIPSQRRLRSQGLGSISATDTLLQGNPSVVFGTLRIDPYCYIATSNIPNAGDGLFICAHDRDITLSKGDCITHFSGKIIYSDELKAQQAHHCIPISSGAQATGGPVIIQDENIPISEQCFGVGHYANHNEKSLFKIHQVSDQTGSKCGVIITYSSEEPITIKKGDALEITFNYGAGAAKKQGLPKTKINGASLQGPIKDLKNIKIRKKIQDPLTQTPAPSVANLGRKRVLPTNFEESDPPPKRHKPSSLAMNSSAMFVDPPSRPNKSNPQVLPLNQGF